MDIQRTLKSTNERKMKAQPKWQDWIILVVGGILFLAPWIYGTAPQAFSSWNAWIVGLVLTVITLRAFLPPPSKSAHEAGHVAWWQAILDNCELIHIAREQVVIGGWLLVAPWILGFAAIGPAAWTAWIAGLLVLLLAVWKLQEFRS